MESLENTCIMGAEPILGVKPDDIRTWRKQNNTLEDLLYAFTCTHNKAWWVEDDVYDFEEGTAEWTKAAEWSDSWFKLLKELRTEVVEIMKKQGYKLPEKGQHKVFAEFLSKYDYYDGNGWWLPGNTIERRTFSNGDKS